MIDLPLTPSFVRRGNLDLSPYEGEGWGGAEVMTYSND
jgi:hypothetical protein